MFTKGHTLSRGKRRPGGGGKKVSTTVKEALDGLQGDLPTFFAQLRERAANGDREAVIYLIDRAIGKPKQQTELVGTEQLGVGLMRGLFEVLGQELQRLQQPLQLYQGDTIEGEVISEEVNAVEQS